jgi:hypothetical protein
LLLDREFSIKYSIIIVLSNRWNYPYYEA